MQNAQFARPWHDDRDERLAQDRSWLLPGQDRPALAAPAGVAPTQRRAEVLRAMFRKLSTWRETEMARSRRQEIEAYLFQASDSEDLERRLRWLHSDGQCRAAALQWQGDAGR